MLLLWAILFMVIAMGLGFLAFNSIAIAIPFFAKFLFLISLGCLFVSLILIVVVRINIK
ncbi:MAG: DUF1328 domain-containing protein [Candidatus Berkiellales bacterium]